MRAPTLALADVHRVTTEIAGRTTDVFLFDHHRTAFTLWALGAQAHGKPLTLVTLDRHMDLGVPAAHAPAYTEGIETLDQFARHRLAPSNDDHIVAAMESGAIADALVVARSHEPPSLAAFQPFVDRTGRAHPVVFAPTLERRTPAAEALVRASDAVVLDIDLDCFTTRSDGHVDEVLCWDREQIEMFLQPPHSAPFWQEVLARTRLVTIAREPYHCGGFDRGARLWQDFADVFFRRLLGVPAP